MSLSSEISLKNIQFPINRPISDESELEYFKDAKTRAINSFEKGYLIQLLTKHRGMWSALPESQERAAQPFGTFSRSTTCNQNNFNNGIKRNHHR